MLVGQAGGSVNVLKLKPSPPLHLGKHPRSSFRYDTFLQQRAGIPDLHPSVELAARFNGVQLKTPTPTDQHTWSGIFIHNSLFRQRRNGVSVDHNTRLNEHACPELFGRSVEMTMDGESALLRIALGADQQHGSIIGCFRTNRTDPHRLSLSHLSDVLFKYIQLHMQVLRIDDLKNDFLSLHVSTLSKVGACNMTTDRSSDTNSRLNAPFFQRPNVNPDHLQARLQPCKPAF